MMRWLSLADRLARILITVLCASGTTTLAAQLGGGPTRTVDQRAAQAQVNPPTTSLPGPRLAPEWPRFEPGVADNNAPARALLASGGDNHTFVFSTLALVLIGVLVVLLVVR